MTGHLITTLVYYNLLIMLKQKVQLKKFFFPLFGISYVYQTYPGPSFINI